MNEAYNEIMKLVDSMDIDALESHLLLQKTLPMSDTVAFDTGYSLLKLDRINDAINSFELMSDDNLEDVRFMPMLCFGYDGNCCCVCNPDDCCGDDGNCCCGDCIGCGCSLCTPIIWCPVGTFYIMDGMGCLNHGGSSICIFCAAESCACMVGEALTEKMRSSD